MSESSIKLCIRFKKLPEAFVPVPKKKEVVVYVLHFFN